MTDFVLATGAAKHMGKEMDPMDVAFVKTKDERK